MDELISFVAAHSTFTAGAVFAFIVVIGTIILAALPMVPIPPADVEQLKAADARAKDRMWEHGLHEDNIFNERLNFFLVFESVSLGVIGALYTHSPNDNGPLRYLALFGLLVSLLWLYVQARQKYVLDSLKARDSVALSDYAYTLRNRRRWPVSTTWLLAYFLPLLVTLIWLTLLAIFDGGIITF
jgi:hypothetical protein